MNEKRSTKDNFDSGHLLALCAAIRCLAAQMARNTSPHNPEQLFTALSERAIHWVDDAMDPQVGGDDEREIKESAYGTLRMIFDPDAIRF